MLSDDEAITKENRENVECGNNESGDEEEQQATDKLKILTSCKEGKIKRYLKKIEGLHP